MTLFEDNELSPVKRDLFFLVDTSESMKGEKIDIANAFIKKTITSDYLAQSKSDYDLKINCLAFSDSCRWITTMPVSGKDFRWNDVLPDDKQSNLGAACFELTEKMTCEEFLHHSLYRPLIILLSDGRFSEDYVSAVEQVNKNLYFTNAIKIAVAIGEDADKDVLAEFTGDAEKVISVIDTKDLDKLLWFFCCYIDIINDDLSPLMIAVKYADKNEVESILESGPDVNTVSYFNGSRIKGYTPLMIACMNNEKDLAELLIDHGADINAKNSGFHAGQTVLMLAAEHNSKETAELLIQHGADVNEKTEWCGYEDCTALMFAAWFGAKETAGLLIEFGAEVNAVRKDGRTALMFAVLRNNKDIVKLLIENGADISITDKDGRTALDIVADKTYAKESVEIISEYAKHTK